MRRVKLGKPPAELVGDESVGGRERAKAIAFFAAAAHASASFDFRAYKEAAVKAAVNATFGFKCAYCESRYAATQPVDVEHYRPKGGVTLDGRLKKPGYYWLGAEWSNLLASCIFCNREHEQTFPDGTTRTTGKGNNFPLATGSRHATRPGAERAESRLLINPYRDNPESHLRFDDAGIVRPARSKSGRESRKGRVSIEILGLQRDGLVRERAALATDIAARVALVKRLALVLEDTGSPMIEATLREEIAKLKGRQGPEQPYSTMARQVTARLLEGVV